MKAKSIESELKKYFPKSETADWKKIATQELSGKNPFENLSWRGKDDLLFLPYYDSVKDADLLFLKGFQLPAATTSAAKTWLNLPAVEIKNSTDANAIALDHLMQGADGVVFNLRSAAVPDLNNLTHNIEWPHCYIGFYLREHEDTLQSLTRLIQDRFDFTSIHGALFWESLPRIGDLKFYLNGNANFKALGLVISSSSPAAEISNALLEGVKAVEKFYGSDLQNVFSSVCFSLRADASFLETVSKFKALRILWFQVAQAYGHSNYKPEDLLIHARVEDVADPGYAPRENMLHSAFATMAALLGGCGALTLESNDLDPSFTRWARNVSSLLRDESYFDRSPDPLSGAWALESITNDIARKAWEMFQKKWREHAAS